jgi:hypothetical protein
MGRGSKGIAASVKNGLTGLGLAERLAHEIAIGLPAVHSLEIFQANSRC